MIKTNIISVSEALMGLAMAAGMDTYVTPDLVDEINSHEDYRADLESADIDWALDMLTCCKDGHTSAQMHAVYSLAGREWPAVSENIEWKADDVLMALLDTSEGWLKPKSARFGRHSRAEMISFYWMWREAVLEAYDIILERMADKIMEMVII